MSNNKTVAVTGASGFLASHIVEQLLAKGYTVHGTVRDPKDPKKVAHLTSLPGASERLVLFKADLLDGPEVFEPAFKGCSAVVHSASPFSFGGSEDDYVKPAVNGTLNALKAVANTKEVTRVVLTSSYAAVAYNGGALPKDHVYTEADWSNADYQRQAKSWYPLSKTLAERAAWDFLKSESRHFSLVTLQPALITGPILQPTLNTSSEIVADYLNGKKDKISNGGIGYVDVRDVAEAHVAAIENPSAEGRYLMLVSSTSFIDLVEILKKLTKGKKYKIPTEVAEGDKFQPSKFDCSKVEKLLGHKLISIEDSVNETVKGLEKHGMVKEQS